jgi:hypothetical protein
MIFVTYCNCSLFIIVNDLLYRKCCCIIYGKFFLIPSTQGRKRGAIGSDSTRGSKRRCAADSPQRRSPRLQKSVIVSNKAINEEGKFFLSGHMYGYIKFLI